jgi:hypothetical protein
VLEFWACVYTCHLPQNALCTHSTVHLLHPPLDSGVLLPFSLLNLSLSYILFLCPLF